MFHVTHTPRALAFLDAELEETARLSLLRARTAWWAGVAGRSFCSNDYLGLAAQPAPPRASGTGASRLVCGDRTEHVSLEAAAAAFVEQPAALAFTSGYAANVGLVSALATRDDLIVSDALNHASLIDGARLSNARIAVVPHLDVDAIRRALRDTPARRRFVVTESYFGMDADAPDLRGIRAACDEYGAALLVDEAHALGVLGPLGRGLSVAAGIRPDAIVGTFGKAFGASGAFVAGCEALVAWLWNRARSFVFSTGISPAVAAAALTGMQIAEREPQRRAQVLKMASRLRSGMRDLGIPEVGTDHIVPWILGESAAALEASSRLRAEGFDVRAIRPPSVPPGTARLRLTLTAAHSDADVGSLVDAIARLGPSLYRPPRSLGRVDARLRGHEEATVTEGEHPHG